MTKVSNADELREAAIFYAKEQGYRVFPVHGIDDNGNCTCGRPKCSHPGKHPIHNGGFKNATDDIEIINAWWTRYPGSNIGLPTGSINGLMVIDVDKDNPGAMEEFYSLELPETTLARSGGGGIHAYFQYPHDFEITTNSKQFRGKLDIRGRGGYVLLSPSNHASGNQYRWEREIEAVPLPDWVATELGADAAREKFVLDDEIVEGTRDDTMFRLASSLRKTGLTEEEIYMALKSVNKRCKPPMEDHELRAKARSASRYAKGQLQTAADEMPLTDIDILSRDQLDELEPPEWLVNGLVPKDSLSIIYGNPGQFKTFVVLDLCLSIATGKPFRVGPDEATHPVQKGVVVYVAAEGARGIKTRVQAWEDEHGIRATDFYVIRKAVQLAQTTERDALIEMLRNLNDTPIMVVFDTLSRCMVGMDENSAQDVSLFIKAADTIKKELGCAVSIVHHSTKDGSSERGSSALRGAADAMYKIVKNEDQVVEMKCDKMKDAVEPKEKRFQFQVVDLSPLGSPPSLVLYPSKDIRPNNRGMNYPPETSSQEHVDIIEETAISEIDLADHLEED